jgi:hypothetical protein
VSTGRVMPQQADGRGAGAGPAVRPALAGRGRGLARPIHVDVRSIAPDVSPLSQAAVAQQLLGGQASDATRLTLAKASSPEQLIALALGSPEFQRR